MHSSSLIQTARLIAKDFAAPHADAADRDARFPQEAIDALKQEKLLSAYIPVELGGAGASLSELVEICEILGRQCAATAMIFAMHQIQVITLVEHAIDHPWYRQYLQDLVKHQYLIASVTSEVGVGGEMRRSRCAVELNGDYFRLVKDATTISYGAQADDLLVTARRHADAANSDQSLILVRKVDYKLEQKGNWDTMGMRGTCSPPFLMTASGHRDQIMEVPFGDMSARTVVPVSHLLWGGCWLGCATAAVNKARSFVRGQARSNPGTVPPTALRLAELVSMLQSLRTSVQACLSEYEQLSAASDAATGPLSSIAYSLKMNNLKVDATQALPQIVIKALSICGILAYKNDSKFSMSRHLRDSLSAALMVGNDRILATNANLLLVLKDD
ncbi:acyl-CoA dehydrogenase family protein [Undibacterium rugosum]|uniref:Acyl-CoA/acyl-ACP dehydrogenase n=1 Tax=Undibacterium rugosum TaxID=2762291 RepID=A0A923KYC2_9BURK|nr:acyl-CoA dehydrogenase family protein [Undibacterium rugosum]MBC3934128.1 acyl-CoA/acyl-ACP dehydrogenase [Undibacterium rugosum]MBR7779153.1 acyl-CoA/acyl-ACP dehydrogenase [Undibacterium rugosum]